MAEYKWPVTSGGSGGGGTWGSITGTLSDQTDLQSALNLKANTADLINYDNMSKIMSAKDSGIFTVVTWEDSGSVRRKESILSGGTAPLFTTRTVTFYDTDGTTVLDTIIFTLTYDGDGDLLSEEL